jgi:hypothetical protein
VSQRIGSLEVRERETVNGRSQEQSEHTTFIITIVTSKITITDIIIIIMEKFEILRELPKCDTETPS